jgi:hypothetical protein
VRFTDAFDPFAKRSGIELLFEYVCGSELLKLDIVDRSIGGRQYHDFYWKAFCSKASHDVEARHDSPIGNDEIKTDRGAFEEHYDFIDVFGENGVMSGQ